jgi:hypothetical protein
MLHDKALPGLRDAVHEVHEHGPAAVLDNRAGLPDPLPLTREQDAVSHVAEDVAQETGGHPGYRPGEKDRARSLAKINGKYQGDAS